MTGVYDQNGKEIQIGDVIEFSGNDYNVVNLHGEDGHDGIFLERHYDVVTDEEWDHNIERIALIAANPARMKVVT